MKSSLGWNPVPNPGSSSSWMMFGLIIFLSISPCLIQWGRKFKSRIWVSCPDTCYFVLMPNSVKLHWNRFSFASTSALLAQTMLLSWSEKLRFYVLVMCFFLCSCATSPLRSSHSVKKLASDFKGSAPSLLKTNYNSACKVGQPIHEFGKVELYSLYLLGASGG